MEANERLYGYGVATGEWNGGDKCESGWYFEDILETLHRSRASLRNILKGSPAPSSFFYSAMDCNWSL